MAEHRCDHCGKTFNSATALTQHQRDTNHHPKKAQGKTRAKNKAKPPKRTRAKTGKAPSTSWFIAGGVGLALVLIAVGAFVGLKQNPTNQISALAGEAVPILGANHVPEGTRITYNSNPPTSGAHWPQPAQWDVYSFPLPDEQLVHNLEHGGIWISYKDIDRETKSKLEAIARKYPQGVILTPRPENDRNIALASWGRLDKFDSFDEERIERFIRSNINNSPEPLASLEQSPVQIGGSFPDFTVTEVDGRIITRDSLKGKPAIIWFTTEFCIPCQIGARRVSRLDDELGEGAFDVLVIFVDPREKVSDLISWRNRFANEDWMVAFDNFEEGSNSLSAKVGLRFLDTKYLLDKNGVIRNIDLQIADEGYLNRIRQIVKES